jgi:FAD/FMN-containing dehydrogenase
MRHVADSRGTVDASGYRGHADEVLVPADESEVAGLLVRAGREGIPITIAGAGTGITGGGVAQGGWVLSLEKFTRLEISPGKAVAGAAVSLQSLQAEAAPTRQFYAPDPTEITASIGGTIATNASGSRSFRYGSTRCHVLAFRVALMDGSIREFRRGEVIDFDVPAIPRPATTKNTAGYQLAPGMDWVDLFVGAEGTLGVVLEAELQLLPAPSDVLAGVVFFPDDARALDAVERWRTLERLRMLEYFDRNSLDLLRTRYSEVPASAGGALLIEEEDPDIDAWLERAPEDNWFAITASDRERFRCFRHALPELVNDCIRRRGFLKLATDYAVPPPRTREMLACYHEWLAPYEYVVFGHIGDGHVHANVLSRSQAEFESASELMLEFARQSVALGGVVSAEHGLGKRKAHLLALQYTPEQIEAMRAVKRRLDPQWLLGRGTLFTEHKEISHR